MSSSVWLWLALIASPLFALRLIPFFHMQGLVSRAESISISWAKFVLQKFVKFYEIVLPYFLFSLRFELARGTQRPVILHHVVGTER